MEPAREVLNLRGYRCKPARDVLNLCAASGTCARPDRTLAPVRNLRDRLALAAAQEFAKDAAEQVAQTALAGRRSGLRLSAAGPTEHLAEDVADPAALAARGAAGRATAEDRPEHVTEPPGTTGATQHAAETAHRVVGRRRARRTGGALELLREVGHDDRRDDRQQLLDQAGPLAGCGPAEPRHH